VAPALESGRKPLGLILIFAAAVSPSLSERLDAGIILAIVAGSSLGHRCRPTFIARCEVSRTIMAAQDKRAVYPSKSSAVMCHATFFARFLGSGRYIQRKLCSTIVRNRDGVAQEYREQRFICKYLFYGMIFSTKHSVTPIE
jgi:hypothetical protein